jgi:hypothetical protein
MGGGKQPTPKDSPQPLSSKLPHPLSALPPLSKAAKGELGVSQSRLCTLERELSTTRR